MDRNLRSRRALMGALLARVRHALDQRPLERAAAGPRDRVASWRYESSPDGAGRRDLRVDLLRGYCIFVMIVDHVGGESSWLYALTGAGRLAVSAAEGFVLLSGFAMGMVHQRTARRGGLGSVFAKVLARVVLLYGAAVGLTLAFAAVSIALGAPYARLATPAPSLADFVISVLTLHRTYPLTDILVLYTILVLVAGPVLGLIARGRTALVLIGSWALWTAAQVQPDAVPRAWSITDGGFPFAAWQALFFTGLVLGFHRERLAAYLRPRWLVAFALAAATALAVARLASVPGGADELLFDKNAVGLGRVVALFGVAALAFALVTLAWRPIRRATGWLLLVLGQRALLAYAVHLFVVAFFASELMAPVRLHRENALFQAAAVGMVWLACLAQAALGDTWRAAAANERTRPRRALAGGVAAAAIAIAAVLSVVAVLPLVPAAGVALSFPSPGTATAVPAERGAGRVEDGGFRSSALRRAMSFTVYLPPGYDADPTRRYPTLYMLHGGSGLRSEWVDYGLLRGADRLMGAGEIAPFIIVLPQGDQEYWVDHVIDASVGANGEKWGTYAAREVVPEIDRRYRTIPQPDARAIGGLSLGGHGAIQLPMNFPGVWSVIGAHSPSLRPYGDAATYLGKGAEFAARDPLSLIKARPDLARTYTWWLDSGELDPFRAAHDAIAAELSALGIAHERQTYPGDHSLAYWSAHIDDYLRYYADALCRRSAACRDRR